MKISKMKELEIMNINENSIIDIFINGNWTTFKPYQSGDDSWDLINKDNSNNLYGLSCVNVGELKSLLLADLYVGVCKDIKVKNVE